MATILPLLLAADGANNHSDARTALDQAGLTFKPWSFQSLGQPDPSSYRLAIVDSAGAADAATAFCRHGRSTQADPRPILWLAESSAARLAGWQAGADAVLPRPFLGAELTAQVESLLRQREERDRLAALVSESRQTNLSVAQFYQRYDADLRIARRIQRSCRPAYLPAVEKTRFAVSHRERSGSGGDFFNVVRADEEHVAFFLGDVMGGSLTAALLSIFVHENVVPKQIHGLSYRLLPPEEVLGGLNRGLTTLGMPDPPLVRLTYGLLNAKSGSLTYACAGHTPPLHLPRSGPAVFWPALGTMLGDADSKHPSQAAQLQPRDRVLLFTDGLDGTDPATRPILLAAATKRRDLPLPSLVEYLTQDLLAQTPEPDDFTMLGLEYA